MKSLSSFASGISERKLLVYASSGCHYLFMSLIPFIMILCCILPYTPFSQELVLGYVDLYFEKSLGDLIRRIVSMIYLSNSGTLTVSILLTLYSASASMKALMNGIDAAYDFKRTDNFLVKSLKAILYMILLIIGLLASIFLLVYGTRILDLMYLYMPHIPILDLILSKLRFVIGLVFLILFFALMYTIVPAKKLSLRYQIPGAIFTAVAWMIFSAVFSFYISISNKYGAYGYIGTLMVAMLWIYYSLFVLLVGGYLNSFLYLENSGKKIPWRYAFPKDLFKP